MTFFTNKHVIIALLAAPILAVITYLSVDQMVKPEAVKAEAGQSIPLVARSNCRYNSGKCTLINGDFRLDLHAQQSTLNPVSTINIESDFPIEGVRYELVDAQGQTLGSHMTSNNSLTINNTLLNKTNNLRLAIKSNNVIYYTETQTTFINQQTL